MLYCLALVHQASGFEAESIEVIASQCYNWGLQGLSLGSTDAGTMSERLIGMAQSFLPHCSDLQHHADSITMVRSRACNTFTAHTTNRPRALPHKLPSFGVLSRHTNEPSKKNKMNRKL